jgi:hypothetical protein
MKQHKKFVVKENKKEKDFEKFYNVILLNKFKINKVNKSIYIKIQIKIMLLHVFILMDVNFR